MRCKTWALLGLFCCWLFVWQSPQAWADTLYVKPVASGQKNGQSWANALGGPLEALILAQKGDHIWMAAGDYNVAEPFSK